MGQQHDFYLVQSGNLVPRAALWRGFLACFQQPSLLRPANLDSSDLDWTKQIASEPNEPCYENLEEARRDCTAFLIPVVEFDEDIPRLLRHYAEEIFEEQLWSWDQREEQWPKQRDFKTLMEWFDVEVSTVVIDLDEIPLVVEDY